MKKILFVFAAMFLLAFGCIKLPNLQPTVPKNFSVPDILPNITTIVEPPTTNVSTNGSTGTGNATATPACNPEYSVSAPKAAVLSGTSSIAVTAKCAAGKVISTHVNGDTLGRSTVSGNSATLNFDLLAMTDGTNSVSVRSDGEEIYSGDWVVSPIGYTNTSGVENDQISIKNWKAVAFNINSMTTVKKIGAYLRTLQSSTLPNNNVVVDIREDSGGSPGAIIATGSLPISSVTMTENWIYFPVTAKLAKGRYWLVFHIDQPASQLVSDSVNIHYVIVDRSKPGNANHKKMDLLRNDMKQTWEETTWETLVYDRNYVFIVSAND